MREYWTDQFGNRWAEPTTKGALSPYGVPSHRALRAFVFWRDHYRCVACGDGSAGDVTAYDGAAHLPTASGSLLVMDHVISRRNGGRHHPSNLQTLCDRCNARKSALVDSKRAQTDGDG